MSDRSSQDGTHLQPAAAFRARLTELLAELEATDEGQVVAGVFRYVQANRRGDHPPDPPAGPENEPQRPETGG